MRKQYKFFLKETTNNILDKIQEEYDFKTRGETLEYILSDWLVLTERNKKKDNQILNNIYKQLSDLKFNLDINNSLTEAIAIELPVNKLSEEQSDIYSAASKKAQQNKIIAQQNTTKIND